MDLILTSKKLHGLIIEGSFGLGKSFVVKSFLNSKLEKWKYLNTYTTALAFYNLLYEYRNEVILIDDLSGIWKDKKGISLLRALLNTEEKRIVTYESTSDKLKVPSKFIFNGKLVILCNDISSYLDKGLISRVLYRSLEFTHNEKLSFCRDIIMFNYPELKEEQVTILYTFLQEQLDECCLYFSFRDLLKIVELFIKYPIEWRSLAIKEIRRDEDMLLIKQLLKLHQSEKERATEYTLLTGKHRATYFRHKKKYLTLIGEVAKSR